MGPVVDHGSHVAPVFFAKVHSPRPSKPGCKFLAGLPHRGGVNNGRHFLDVVHQDAMIKCFVAIVQVFQHDILFDVGFFVAKCCQEALLLEMNIHNSRRQHASESKAIAFPCLERRSLVEERLVQNIGTSNRNVNGSHERSLAASPFSHGWKWLVSPFLARCAQRSGPKGGFL